jgi:BMFP domain-containing protein YqiC
LFGNRFRWAERDDALGGGVYPAPRTTQVRATPRAQEEKAMKDSILRDLSARLAEMAAANPAKDLEKNFRGVLASVFARADLVTREEYDVQALVLQKSATRSRLRLRRRSARAG